MAAENRLTDARIRTATLAKDGPYLADGGGLRVRLKPPTSDHPDGLKLFEFHFKLKTPDGTWRNGAIHLGTYGDTYADDTGKKAKYGISKARADRDEARALVAKGIDPREARRLQELDEKAEQARKLAEHAALANRRTVKDAFGSWMSLYLAREHKDGGALVEGHFNRHVLPEIGEKALDDLKKADVLPILDRLVESGNLRTANVVLSLVRQFARWGMSRDWITQDPTFGLTKRGVGGTETKRQRALSFEEIAALPERMIAAKLPERIRHAVWVLLATAARVGELSAVRVDDVDIETGTWTIPAANAKNGREHVVHLSPFAIEHVRALITLGKGKDGKVADWLMPGRDRTTHIDEKLIAKSVKDRQRTKKLKGRSKLMGALLLAGGAWTPHDLRRTAASRMQDIGVAPHVIEKCLNHTLEGVAAVYQTADLLPERKAAFDKWGAKIEATIKGAKPAPVADLAAARAKRTRKPGA